MITAEEFEKQYAARCGITVERLRYRGRVVRACHCGDKGCEGQQSISLKRMHEEEEDWKAGRCRAPDWIEEVRPTNSRYFKQISVDLAVLSIKSRLDAAVAELIEVKARWCTLINEYSTDERLAEKYQPLTFHSLEDKMSNLRDTIELLRRDLNP